MSEPRQDERHEIAILDEALDELDRRVDDRSVADLLRRARAALDAIRAACPQKAPSLYQRHKLRVERYGWLSGRIERGEASALEKAEHRSLERLLDAAESCQMNEPAECPYCGADLCQEAEDSPAGGQPPSDGSGQAEGMTPEMMLHDIHYWGGEAHRLGEEAASLQRENERLNRKLVEMYCRIIPEEIAKGVDRVLEAIQAEQPVAYAAERGVSAVPPTEEPNDRG